MTRIISSPSPLLAYQLLEGRSSHQRSLYSNLLIPDPYKFFYKWVCVPSYFWLVLNCKLFHAGLCNLDSKTEFCPLLFLKKFARGGRTGIRNWSPGAVDAVQGGGSGVGDGERKPGLVLPPGILSLSSPAQESWWGRLKFYPSTWWYPKDHIPREKGSSPNKRDFTCQLGARGSAGITQGTV